MIDQGIRSLGVELLDVLFVLLPLLGGNPFPLGRVSYSLALGFDGAFLVGFCPICGFLRAALCSLCIGNPSRFRQVRLPLGFLLGCNSLLLGVLGLSPEPLLFGLCGPLDSLGCFFGSLLCRFGRGVCGGRFPLFCDALCRLSPESSEFCLLLVVLVALADGFEDLSLGHCLD